MPPTAIPMLDLTSLHAPILAKLENAIRNVVQRGEFINGPEVAAFEQHLASWLNIDHAIGTSSGTDALLVSMMALGVKPGDRVITTPYTFFATAGAIRRLGAIPVFADIREDSFEMDLAHVESLIHPNTVGMIPVHLFGEPTSMTELNALAQKYNLWVIEDAAQSIGASIHTQPVGTFGTIGTFSFFPAKNLGAAGDAGAVVTQDRQLADTIRSLRVHGASPKYYHRRLGGNFRMDTIQAAFLDVKLPYLKQWNTARIAAAMRYFEWLNDAPRVRLPRQLDGHVYNQFVVGVPPDERVAIIERLSMNQIAHAVYYPTPLHLQPCFEDLGYIAGDFPNAEKMARCALAIPISPTITTEQQQRVVNALMSTKSTPINLSR